MKPPELGAPRPSISFFFPPNMDGFSWKPLFLCVPFYVKLAKNGGLFYVFLAQKWNWLWFHDLKVVKIMKPSRFGREKNETDARGIWTVS